MSIGAVILAFVVVMEGPSPLETQAHPRTRYQAVADGLQVLQRAARAYPSHRQCYSCHHQTLPMLAMLAAREAGWTIDDELLNEQLEFTRESFRDKIADLRAGQKVGGRAVTVSYALWTLHLMDAAPDELSEALAAYLLNVQAPEGAWRPPSIRPPIEESDVSCTVLSAYGLLRYASHSQHADALAAIDKAKGWLASAPLESHEDKVARLWGLSLLGGSDDELRQARQTVLDAQNEDGGWSQLPEMASDAYATGTTLYVLFETGTPKESAACQRGLEFLTRTQESDGSWFVQTRANPVQVFFDNGDPHGKSQFISIAATGWAVTALSLAAAADPAPTKTSAEAPTKRETIVLWPEGAPGAVGDEETDRPTLEVYLPPKETANGCAVVVCPGGGYGHLAVGHEGDDIGKWFNSFGVTAFVLRYRIAPRYQHPAPMLDVQRAIRTVRAKAKSWNISPDRIGVMGFSAGGHLASTAATHFDPGAEDADDPVDRVSCRPDFAILIYPVISLVEFAHKGSLKNLLGDDPDPELVESLSNDKQVTSETPPTFLMHTGGDTAVPSENSVLFYLALRKAGVPTEMHIYEKGKHGFGLAADDPVLSSWPDRCKDWFKTRGLLEK